MPFGSVCDGIVGLCVAAGLAIPPRVTVRSAWTALHYPLAGLSRARWAPCCWCAARPAGQSGLQGLGDGGVSHPSRGQSDEVIEGDRASGEREQQVAESGVRRAGCRRGTSGVFLAIGGWLACCRGLAFPGGGAEQ